MDTQGVEFHMPIGSAELRITHPLLLSSCTSTVLMRSGGFGPAIRRGLETVKRGEPVLIDDEEMADMYVFLQSLPQPEPSKAVSLWQ